MPSWIPSENPGDTIEFGEINTGFNFAGNGGNGTNNGNLNDNDQASFTAVNNATGADVFAHAGDFVWANASWDAGGGGPGVGTGIGGSDEGGAGTGTGTGGSAQSDGDQYVETGGNTNDITANTTATQTNYAAFYQGATQLAGIGGAGGSDNAAVGGHVSFSLPDTHVITVGDISVDLDHLA